VYTGHARRNLLAEGIHPRRIYKTGSPMREVLEHYMPLLESSNVLSRLNLEENKYFLVSLHREENVDDETKLRSLVTTLDEVAEKYNVPVIVSTHPRTRKRIDALGVKTNELIVWMQPFGFLDYNKLQSKSLCVISDSGTIAEESSILGFTAITPRFSIERPEALDTGAIIACGTKTKDILDSIDIALTESTDPCDSSNLPDDYSIQNTSARVVKLIIGTARLSNAWDGIAS